MSLKRSWSRFWPALTALVLPILPLVVLLHWTSAATVVSKGKAAPAESSPLGQAEQRTVSTPFYPVEPPDASKITVSPPDVEGYATVTGKAGAVPPNVYLALANLKARVPMTATADASGAFSATLYSPPGSPILIKYDRDADSIKQYWKDVYIDDPSGVHHYLNPLPGTIIQVGPATPGEGKVQPFYSVGSHTEGSGWNGWWLSGTLEAPGVGDKPGLTVEAGDTLTLSARVRVTVPSITCNNPPPYNVDANIDLRYLFRADGRAHYWGNYFDNFLFTPTGLPIEHTSVGEFQLVKNGQVFTGLTCVSDHALEGFLQTTFTVPADFSDGIYQPVISVLGTVPQDPSLPEARVWYDGGDSDWLPPIRVGSPAEPQIPWVLLADYPVNGHRGLQAREDAGRYQLNPWNVTPPGQVVIPRLEARSGEPIAYRLEPGSNWVSGNERRLPNPPVIALMLPSGMITIEVDLPDGGTDVLGPAPILQSSSRTPTLPDGTMINFEGGSLSDVFHLHTMDDAFAYAFEQYGPHVIRVSGYVDDIYGIRYQLDRTFDVIVARVLDLDPAQLPATPHIQGDAFPFGLHLFPPVPAEVAVELLYMPFSDPDLAETRTINGTANRFGYFQPEPGTPPFIFEQPGEFRADISAQYVAPDGTLWAGTMTWGSVVEGTSSLIEAHGRRGMNYVEDKIDNMPIWFYSLDVPENKRGPDTYYPYLSGDIHWGNANALMGGDSIMPMITLLDTTANETITGTFYDVIKSAFPRTTNVFRPPPGDRSYDGLVSRLRIGEAPLFLAARSGIDPPAAPEDVDLWAYWYGASQRPDVRVKELVTEDGTPTPYWRFDDTYGIQIGQAADGDQPGDLKWEFGGIVFRLISETNPITEYAVYSSLWVLLPNEDTLGTRIGTPFQDATGASFNFGPIFTYTLDSQTVEVNMLFLPKGVRPGDVLELGDVVSFSGHVGPPLDSRVAVTITSPSNAVYTRDLHANRIGWFYDPGFDLPANETGRWTVEVAVEHDRPYAGNDVTPESHNTGTVMGTTGQYSFYVVEPDSLRLSITEPGPGFITWPNQQISPIVIRGLAPAGTTAVHYTVHDKGVVMDQGTVTPDAYGSFTLIYDAELLHQSFSMLSLTAHDAKREGLSDEVAINLLAVGEAPRANTVTLIGEEVFVDNAVRQLLLPVIVKGN